MRYFLDTNVLINLIEDGFLTDKVRSIITDCENTIYISSECVREFILLAHCNKFKVKKGKLKLDIFDFIEKELGFKIKYVAKEHLKTYSNLEIAENHDDTFDHLIIAHAITEKIPIISSDAYFPKYKKQGLELISNKRK